MGQKIKIFDFYGRGSLKVANPNSTHFATLEEDLQGDFPTRFSVCSTKWIGRTVGAWNLFRNSEKPSRPWFMTNNCAGCRSASDNIRFGAPYDKDSSTGFLSHEFNYWSHLCIAVDMDTGNVTIVRDGHVTWNAVMEEFRNISLKPKSLAGNLNLGLYFYKKREWSRNHKIGNLNIYASKLSIEAMKSITNGSRCGENGDYLAWSKSKWFYTGNDIQVLEVEHHELCNQYPKSSIYITPSEPWRDVLQACKKLGKSRLHVPRDKEHAEKVFDYYMGIAHKNVSGILQRFDDLERYFIGGELDWITNTITDINTGKPLKYARWMSGHPEKSRKFYRTSNGYKPTFITIHWISGSVNYLPLNEWITASTSISRSGVCENNGKPVFRMRGLPKYCKGIKDMFTPSNDGQNNGLIGYVGYRHCEIGYNRALEQWELFNYEKLKPKPYATSKASIRSLALGTQNWILYNMSKLCTSDSEFHVKIDMNSCSGEEFNCNDGECIDMQKRCDGRVNCFDESDEIDCNIIVASSSYDKEITPLPEDIEKKAEILVSLTMRKILEINEIEQKFRVGYLLSLRWKDRRLKYHNLKKNPSLNFLSKSERLSVWTPSIVLFNTESEETIAQEEKTDIKVIANRNFSHDTSDATTLKNIYIFDGETNDIEMSWVLQTVFICTYDMGLYPFDTQTCTLDFLVTDKLKDFCYLESGNFSYTGPNELTQYFIKQYFMRNNIINKRNGVSIFIILGRRLLSNILTIYLPTVLLNLIGHLTTYFKPYFFEVNVMQLLIIKFPFYLILGDHNSEFNCYACADYHVSILKPIH